MSSTRCANRASLIVNRAKHAQLQPARSFDSDAFTDSAYSSLQLTYKRLSWKKLTKYSAKSLDFPPFACLKKRYVDTPIFLAYYHDALTPFCATSGNITAPGQCWKCPSHLSHRRCAFLGSSSIFLTHVLGVFPVLGGKSLTYQVPALCLDVSVSGNDSTIS